TGSATAGTTGAATRAAARTAAGATGTAGSIAASAAAATAGCGLVQCRVLPHRGVGTRCARTRARTRTGGALLTGTARLLTRLRHDLPGRERVVAGACSLAALTAGASARLGSATAGLRHTLRRGEGVVARACGRPAAGLRGRRLRSGGLGCCRLRGGGLGGTGLRSGGLGRRCTVGLGLGCRGLGGLGLLGCGRGGLGARLRCGLRRRVARLGGARFRRGSLGAGLGCRLRTGFRGSGLRRRLSGGLLLAAGGLRSVGWGGIGEGLSHPAHDGRFERRGGRANEFAHILELLEDVLTGCAELFRELMDTGLCHSSPVRVLSRSGKNLINEEQYSSHCSLEFRLGVIVRHSQLVIHSTTRSLWV